MKKDAFELALKDLEVSLDHLKALFDQYFQGFERLPPVRQRDAFERELRDLMRQQPNNTALKFRYQTLRQKHMTLANYWNRVLRQIEEGTYKRDIQKARRRRARRAQREQPKERESAYELDVDVELDLDAEIDSALDAMLSPKPAAKPKLAAEPKPEPKPPALKPPKPPPAAEGPVTATFGKPRSSTPPRKPIPGRPAPPPMPKKPARKPAAASGSVGEQEMRRIYDSYVQARRANNERVDNLKFETVAKSIRKQLPKLQQKHQGKKIDFEVVVKDGRVGLKPIVK